MKILFMRKLALESSGERCSFQFMSLEQLEYHVGRKGDNPNIVLYTNMKSRWWKKMSSRTMLPNVITTSPLWLLNTRNFEIDCNESRCALITKYTPDFEYLVWFFKCKISHWSLLYWLHVEIMIFGIYWVK